MRTLLNDKLSVEWKAPEGLVYKECFNRKEWFLEENSLLVLKLLSQRSVVNTQISVQ